MLNRLGLLFLLGTAIFADVTLRYKTDVQMASFLPPAATEELKKATDGKLPALQSIRVKGTRAWSEGGGLQCMVDLAKGDLTLLDLAHQRFATLPASQFTDTLSAGMPQIPSEARKAIDAAKITFDSHMTGRTETIQAIQAEEREATFSLEMPVPGSEGLSSISMKLVMFIWTAKPEEALRVPAIRELTAHNLWTSYLMNPTGQFKKLLPFLPGSAQGFSSMFEEMSKNKAVVLRMRTEFYMPYMGQPGQPMPPGFDSNAPLMQITLELSELSPASIEDAVFQVPEGFQSAAVEDIMRGISEAQLLK